ncbi:hypothetical protein [Methylacidimicrobium sp. B4]|uniref:hypothetical protein n=1 Tax=Methylacidimicrobium sp. B4 TaxID=2796139 RepID=UPI001A8EC2B3|nr:hypothetical protein [Methylacidimicrobium sp. B4]QSR84996.1 hypothetical protein MacB4_01620 [Methylacidimicrobium sp. B4]
MPIRHAMPSAPSLRRTTFAQLPLQTTVLWLILLTPAPAQVAEPNPGDPSSATPAPSQACCPDPPPPPAPPQPPATNSSANGADSSDAHGQNDTDPPNLKKARWPTRSELQQLQAAQLKAASPDFRNDFSNRPAWVNAMGDPPIPAEETSQSGLPSGDLPPLMPPMEEQAPAPPTNGPYTTDLLTNLHAAEENPGPKPVVCLNGWFRMQMTSHVVPEPYLLVYNSVMPDIHFSSTTGYSDLFSTGFPEAWFPEESKQLADGDLSKLSPNFVEIPRSAVQPGDTFVIPEYVDTDRRLHIGHIGLIDKGESGQLDTVSTNVSPGANLPPNPGWTRIPLSRVESWYSSVQGYQGTASEKHIRYFRYVGPWPDPNPLLK